MAQQLPKLLHDNRLDDAIPVASSTAAGFDVLHLRDWRPYTFWKPSSTPATVTVDCAGPKPADYAALYAHDLAGANAAGDLTWTPDGLATVWSDVAAAADGQLNADKIVEDAASGVHQVIRAITVNVGVTNRVAFLLKAAGRPRVRAFVSSTVVTPSGAGATFDLVNGTTSAPGGGAVASIERYPNGWWHCSYTFTPVASGNMFLNLDNGSTNNYAGDGVSGVYVGRTRVNPPTFEVRGSTDNFSASNVLVASHIPLIDLPLVLTFTQQAFRYWRIGVTGGNPPTIAIAAIGAANALTRYLLDFDPLAREAKGAANRSEEGHPLGRVITFEEWRAQVSVRNVTWDWVRSDFAPIWTAHLRSTPFLLAWDSGDHPTESRLVQSGGRYATAHRPGGLCDLQFDVMGVA